MGDVRRTTDRRRVIVLDDDPTGSQEATDAAVLIDYTAAELRRLVLAERAVYVITNTRSLTPGAVSSLLSRIRHDIAMIESTDGLAAEIVLRGDSTLRGHVLLEADAFGARDGVTLLVPAYPSAGRTTQDGVHWVRVDGECLNAADTEFARDPVFGYRARTIPDYVRELEPGRPAGATTPARLVDDVVQAPNGAVLSVDATTDADLTRIVAGVAESRRRRHVVVRCAAPLAAEIAGVRSHGLLAPVASPGMPVLVVVGSHTAATSRQVSRLLEESGASAWTISTEAALLDPDRAAREHVPAVREALRRGAVVVVMTERTRRDDHDTLAHGARVMEAIAALTAQVSDLAPTVVAKGGITSAEVARIGLGAVWGRVLGQVATGVSQWRLDTRHGAVSYIAVPGNIGGPQTLAKIVSALRESSSA